MSFGRATIVRPAAMVTVAAALLIAGLINWSPLIALAAIAVVSVALFAWLRPFYLLALLVLGLPFHVFATRVMVGRLGLSASTVNLFALWKEGVMALLAVVLLVRRILGQDRFRVPLYPFDLGLACVALLMGVYILPAARLGIGIYGFRNYLEPLVVFYLLRAIPATHRQLRWLIGGIFLVSVVMALFGIYQANFWNFTDLYNWGFRNEDGTIPNAFYMAVVERQPRLRAVSTVTSPNELGLMLVLAIIMAVVLLLKRGRPTWQRGLLLGVAVVDAVGLLFTFSRSALVGLIVAVLALAVLEVGVRRLGRVALNAVRSPGTVLVLVALAALLFVGAERVGLLARFTRSFTFSDPSAVGHLASFEASIPFIVEHPLGIGIGMAGPRALRFADEAKIEHVESSYFQMMIEIGIPGTLFTLGVLLLMIWTLRRQGEHCLENNRPPSPPALGGAWFPPELGGQGGLFEGISLAGQVAWLGAMAAFAFLPLMQELQLMSWLWVVAGVAFVMRRGVGRPPGSPLPTPSDR